MPEISRFYGIVIKIYFADHLPPHFHAEYGSEEGLWSIENLQMFAGSLPPRAKALIAEWAGIHQAELREDWNRANSLQPLAKIAPLP
ncbi:MAG TPA: DUF4160 domain-containing protein [Terriglobia bacterium]|nr:DUF4160 domain-containing protein [Terriglobia bacterium]